MPQPPHGIQKACQVLRRRVRFKEARLRLPGNHTLEYEADTEAIREATRLYVESWIIPIIDAIETGENQHLKELLCSQRGDKMEDETDA